MHAPAIRYLAAALFRIENSRSVRDVLANLRPLLAILNTSGTASLRRAFEVWVNKVVLARMRGRSRGPYISLEKRRDMLEDAIDEWRRQAQREGMRKGMRDGKIAMLLTQLRARSGRNR